VVADPDWLESNDSLHPIGSGPFVFDSWQIDSKLVAKKNARYWRTDANGARLPYLDEVEFQVVPDGTNRTHTLESGQADMIQLTSPDQIADFQRRADNGEYQIFANAKGETAELFVQLNSSEAPFDDPDARRALAFATDKQEVIDTLGAGLYEPANGPFAPGSRWFTPNDYPQHDLAKAQQLVDQVKARHGGRFAFEVLGQPNIDSTRALQYLQQQWAKVGIEASIKTMDQATGIIAVITGRYQAVLWQQFDTPHPIGDGVWWLPELVTPPGEFSLNFARHKDDELGRLLHQAAQTPDRTTQDDLYRKVGKRLSEDVPYVWLYHTQNAVVARPRVVNVVNYTLPDGHKGLPMVQGSTLLTQVWLRGTG
jgi:peptide/nickel transport system substrate-binding protein